MKCKLIFLSIVLLPLVLKGQNEGKFGYTTTLGTNIPLSQPSHTPFIWHVLCHYHITQRLSAGGGTGLSFYEKMLIPVFADIKYKIGPNRRFTPYAACGAGYAFAPSKQATGGFYLNPSVGIYYPVNPMFGLQLAVGYEIQTLKRVKEQTDHSFAKAFEEKLNHRSLSIKLGLSF